MTNEQIAKILEQTACIYKCNPDMDFYESVDAVVKSSIKLFEVCSAFKDIMNFYGFQIGQTGWERHNRDVGLLRILFAATVLRNP